MIEDLVSWLRSAPSVPDLNYEVQNLLGIKAWAIEQTGFSVGDTVVISRLIDIGRASGWWAYREALAVGARGEVTEIRWVNGGWLATVRLDKEWTVSPWGGEVRRYWNGPPEDCPSEMVQVPGAERSLFAIPLDHLTSEGQGS